MFRAIEAYMEGIWLVVHVGRRYDFRNEDRKKFPYSFCFAR